MLTTVCRGSMQVAMDRVAYSLRTNAGNTSEPANQLTVKAGQLGRGQVCCREGAATK